MPSRTRLLFALPILSLVALLAVGCKTNQATTGPGGQTASNSGNLARSETLYVAGFQWGAPSNFNPFATNAAWPTNEELLYETLMAYNMVSGKFEPILAKEYKWTDKLTCQVTLYPDTKWQDGKPVTADDVVFTLELGKKFPLAFSPLWTYVTEVKKVDDRTIRIAMNPQKPHRALVENSLFTAPIVPKHLWESIAARGGSLQSETNLQPVGSGPYKVMAYSAERVVLVRDDGYWGASAHGKPAPKYVVHPIFKSNDAGNLALERGEVDLSQNFCPEIWQMWEDKKLPVSTWLTKPPYHLPGTIPMLTVNVHRKGLDNPKVRRALAFAIDYPKIAEIAMSRYSAPAQSSLVIPEGVPESRFNNKEDVAKLGWRYDPKQAVAILEGELKAKKGADGIYVLPDGTRLGPWKIECPYGWTDWMTSLKVVADSAHAVGIDVATDYPDTPIWTDHRDNGNFDLLMNSPAGGQGPAHPWLRFHDVMDSRGVPPMGKVAFWNCNRYDNPAVAPLLDKAAVAATEAEAAAAYRELNRIFMQDIPAIPLEYRPWEFYEFNEAHWKGFPTAQNPAGPPQHAYAGVKTLFMIKPASEK